MKRLILLAVLAGCGPEEPECVSTVECGGTAALQACIEGECVEVACLAASDCAIEEFCSAETYTCEPGCSTSDDCFVGDRCDVELGQCVPRSCTDTQVDCAFGERCDASSGECFLDPEAYCRRCASQAQCGPTGICAQLSRGGSAYCFLECSPEAFDPCPAGMQCTFQSGGETFPDGFRCVGQCDAL